MKNQIIYTFVFLIIFLSLLFFTEFLYKRFNLQAEITRKFAHIVSTLFSLVFLVFFQSFWYVLLLGFVFFSILFTGKYFNFFKSIESVQRKTAGSYLLPVSIGFLFFFSKLANQNLYFILPILILGICDPLAGILGTIYKDRTKKIVLFNHVFNKTILGSSVFFISAFIISFLVLKFFSNSTIHLGLLSLGLASVVTIVEVLSSNGLDNITVPQTTLLILYLTSF